MENATILWSFPVTLRQGFLAQCLARMVLLMAGAGLLMPIGAFGVGCTPAPPGLVSWWRGEDNTEDVVGGNNGTLNGGTTFAAGEVGQAFSFNGVNGFVQVSDEPTLDFQANSPISIELWAYRTGAETTMHLVGKRMAGCGAVQYEIYFDPYAGLAFDGGNGSVQTGWQMPLNTWVHLAGTYDGTNTFRFYTNGVLAATGTGNLGPANSGAFTIGSSGGCSYFAGMLDEISLYSNCLSASQIQAIYGAGSLGKCFTPPSITNQPVAQTLLAGENAILTVGSVGSSPLVYQWLLNGTNMSGGTSNPLILTNSQPTQSGSYSLVVSNYAGSVTSSIAALTVVAPVPGQVVVADQAGLLAGLASGGHVTFAVNGTILLSKTVTITNDVTLDASGYNVGLNGSNVVRAFYVNPGAHLGLINLAISNGTFMAPLLTGGYAGAIYNEAGTVDLVNCLLAGNSCVGSSYTNSGQSNGFSGYGGAIFNDGGILNITNSSFLTNMALGGVSLGDDYYDKSGGNFYGGAIYNNGGSVNAVGSSFLGNSGVGGRIYYDTGYGGSAFGGAIYSAGGTVTMVNCSFTSNTASSVTEGNPSGQSAGGAIYQQAGALILNGVTFSTNNTYGGTFSGLATDGAYSSGGAIFNGGTLNATNCFFLGNSALASSDFSQGGQAVGGAINNGGYATIASATFLGNSATGGGGADSFGGSAGDAGGGALFNTNVVVLVNSTFSSNSSYGAASSGGVGGSAYGGAVCNLGSIFATNDTITLNLCVGGAGAGAPAGIGNGGGLFNQGGHVVLNYLTIASNSAVGSVGVGGGVNATNGSLLVLNSIVAENMSGGDFYGSYGALADGGDNISSDLSFPFSAPGSTNNTNPLLGPLGNNGGPTQTMPLLAGSPAINAAGVGDIVTTDQRWFQRPSGPEPDIGAFEYQNGTTYVISGTVSFSGLPGQVSLSVGSIVISTQGNGEYELGLTNSGNYIITPISANYYFIPSSISVTVGPNQSNLNFEAYPWNVLTFEGSTGGLLRFRFTSQHSGQTFRTQVSSNLVNWTPIATNTLGASNYFDLSFPITSTISQFYRTVIP